MNCRDATRLLNGYVDAELDLTAALALEDHLQLCPRCRAQEAALRSLRSTLRLHTEFLTAPDGLRERLQTRYGRESAGGWRGLRRWFIVGLPASAALLVVAFLGIAGLKDDPTSAPATRKKVVFHISSSDTATTALRNLANHLEASPQTRVVVVAHNDGVDFLLRGARDESGRAYEATVRKFKESGVEFRVCNNTLVRRSIDANRIIPEASLVPSGIAEITRLQGQEGYAYMRL